MPARSRTESPPDLALLALVRSIHLQKQTGLVEFETEESEKHLYFVSGELYLSSSAPSARKVAHLLRMQVSGDQGSRQMLALLNTRIAERFSSWDTRTFDFIEGRRAPSQELVGPLPTAQILMAAAAEARGQEYLARQLGADGVLVVADTHPRRPLAVSISPDDALLLSAIEEPTALEDLLTEAEDGHPEPLAGVARLWAVGLIQEVSEAPALADDGEDGEPHDAGHPSPSEADDGRAEAGSSKQDEIYDIWQRHYGLTGDPFALTPDPAFLFISDGHGEALAGLKLGLLERRGLLAMTGEVGTGKTTLLYSLLSGLDPDMDAAYIYNTTLSFEEILQSSLKDFGVPYTGTGRLELLEALNNFLARLAASDRTAALVIDEAQNLSDETFEQLRLLLNFETFDHKLLQIVLVGQPELARRLQAPRLRQIADRIAVRCHLHPLGRGEARQYVLHRLAAAGASSDIFSQQALGLVLRKAKGVPRRINVICHNAMLFAYAVGQQKVSRGAVREALRETRSSVSDSIRRLAEDKKTLGGTLASLLGRLPRALRSVKLVWIAALGLAAALWLGLAPVDSARDDNSTVDSESDAVTRETDAEPPVGSDDDPAGAQRLDSPDATATATQPATGSTTTNLRLRARPGLDSPVLGVLPQGSEVSILEAQEDWLRIADAGLDRTGWVSSLYVVGPQDGEDNAPVGGGKASSA